MARNYSNLYGQESKQKDGVQYEVARLPLQDHVSTVRRFLCKNWKAFQSEKNKFKNSVSSSFQSAQGAMKSVGIDNTGVVLKASAIGTAALVAAYFARKKSTTLRIVYPTLAGAITWDIIYSSSAENRAYMRSQLKKIWDGYLKKQ